MSRPRKKLPKPRSLKDSPFSSLEQFLDSVSWRVEYEAKKVGAHLCEADVADLCSEGNVALIKLWDARSHDLHLVSPRFIHVVARRAMATFYRDFYSIHSRRVYGNLVKFRRYLRAFGQHEGREVSAEEAMQAGRAGKTFVLGDTKFSLPAFTILEARSVLREHRYSVVSGDDADRDLWNVIAETEEPSRLPIVDREALQAAIDKLRPLQKQAIVEHYLKGRKLAPIAAERGCTVAAVSFHLVQGVRRLRKLLAFSAFAQNHRPRTLQPKTSCDPV